MKLSPELILGVVSIYFLLLMAVSYFTSREADNADFFTAGKKSPWFLVAFGMIGASLSGVTFISIPGAIGGGGTNQAFSYMQMVLGYLVGYAVIATVLMPLYYRLNLTSIYGYLEERFGFMAYKTGAGYFLLSRVIGASFRLYLVAIVLQKFVMEPFGIPFWATVSITIILIWIYTFRGGIKTIVWTDTLQTTCMLLAVILTIGAIGNALDTDLGGLYTMVKKSEYSQMFFFEGGWSDANNFFKQFISGALIALVMTGLDQDMMQKNLSCKTLGEAQKNMFTFSIILVFANLLFITLGALLYIYASNVGIPIPERADQLFPTIALQYLSPFIGIVFILGLVAAAYSSADSALTALTTSFCVDFLEFENENEEEELMQKIEWAFRGVFSVLTIVLFLLLKFVALLPIGSWLIAVIVGIGLQFLGRICARALTYKTTEDKLKIRRIVHVGVSVVLLLTILLFNAISNDSVINEVFKAAGFTYGPLLGLFAFGLLSSRQIQDRFVLPVCIVAPIVTYLINRFSTELLGGFEFGSMIILLNGFLTFIGLILISYEERKPDYE